MTNYYSGKGNFDDVDKAESAECAEKRSVRSGGSLIGGDI
jgi:hypothetical protein